MAKFRTFLASLMVVCSTLVTTPTQAAEQLDNGVWVDLYRYGGGSGRLLIAFYAENADGKLAICGTYFMYGSAAQYRRFERALHGYRFFYNGRVLMTNADFLARTEREEQLGEIVSCTRTDVPFAQGANDLLGGRLPFSR